MPDSDLEYDIMHSHWRVGRKLGRTIYGMTKSSPSDDDGFIGIMETTWLAEAVVSSHNLALLKEEARLAAPPPVARRAVPRYVLTSDGSGTMPRRGILDDFR